MKKLMYFFVFALLITSFQVQSVEAKKPRSSAGPDIYDNEDGTFTYVYCDEKGNVKHVVVRKK